MSAQCVVCRYYENTEWTAMLNVDTIIYNKNLKDYGKYTYNQPNKGCEGYTYLTHIINNYDNLPDYTAFVTGNPFDHCPDTINLINNLSENCF